MCGRHLGLVFDRFGGRIVSHGNKPLAETETVRSQLFDNLALGQCKTKLSLQQVASQQSSGCALPVIEVTLGVSHLLLVASR